MKRTGPNKLGEQAKPPPEQSEGVLKVSVTGCLLTALGNPLATGAGRCSMEDASRENNEDSHTTIAFPTKEVNRPNQTART